MALAVCAASSAQCAFVAPAVAHNRDLHAVRSARACMVAKDPFDEMLAGMLADADELGSMGKAVDGWLDRLDERFIPMLGSKLEAAEEYDDPLLPRLREIMEVMQGRSQDRFERARGQLETLLEGLPEEHRDGALHANNDSESRFGDDGLNDALLMADDKDTE